MVLQPLAAVRYASGILSLLKVMGSGWHVAMAPCQRSLVAIAATPLLLRAEEQQEDMHVVLVVAL